ncbi:MAG: hypothetical protein ACLQPD_31930, partial [Desulfomonilaceae bacterium]
FKNFARKNNMIIKCAVMWFERQYPCAVTSEDVKLEGSYHEKGKDDLLKAINQDLPLIFNKINESSMAKLIEVEPQLAELTWLKDSGIRLVW